MNSSRPYLLRAIYEWLIDNDQTPYLMVNAQGEGVVVPRDFVENGKIVLNIEATAVGNFRMGNDAVEFDARQRAPDARGNRAAATPGHQRLRDGIWWSSLAHRHPGTQRTTARRCRRTRHAALPAGWRHPHTGRPAWRTDRRPR